ncbi:MAG: single-stranded DNA-binding protein [Phycisphaeraceae bacterium]|nr:single-stranded DNA-binding protein [Phycisphaeraceae bacterium]
MANLNRIFLMGNLTRDPELRQTQNSVVCQLGLAINRRTRKQEGPEQEQTTFVDAEAWGRMAEVLAQYLRKGDPVFVEGRVKQDRWKNNEGQNRSKMKVVVESFQFLPTSHPEHPQSDPDVQEAASRPRRKRSRQTASAG